MPPAKKLIEVALPLDAINRASAREKSIRHGHPSTLHLWWSRKPLATTRAVIFASLVDDPDDPDALPEFVAACQALPGDGPNVKREGDTPRMRLFDFIERLVTWEATTDETIMAQARKLIRIATKGNPPPLLDPFAGGGSIPLEAQRLGLEAHASDLNPVAVMINKAMIEIPPRFADMPPVNPRDRKGLFPPHPPAPSPTRGEGEQTPEKWDVSPELRRAMTAVARGLRKEPTEAEDRLWQAIRRKQLLGRKFRRQMPIGAFVVDFYCPSDRLVVEVDGGVHDHQLEADQARQELIESLGIRFLRLTNDVVMRDLPGALSKIEQALSPHARPHPQTPSPIKGEGASTGELAGDSPSPLVGERATIGELAGDSPSPLVGEGATIDELAGDSPSPLVGERATIGELAGDSPSPFVGERATIGELAGDSPSSLVGERATIGELAGDSPSPLVGEGVGGWGAKWQGAAGLAADVRYYGEWMRERAYERIGHLYPKHKGETVIAWLWARTVISPNPAVNAPVPLVRSFVLSKKKGRECWAKPVVEGTTVRFEVTPGKPPDDQDGTMGRKFGGGRCVISDEPMSWEYVRAEGKAGRMGEMMMAIVTEGKRGRNYYSPDSSQTAIAAEAENMDYFKPSGRMPLKHRNFQPPVYGMYEFGDLFTPRQLTALTTFSDLVHEAREKATRDALAAMTPHPPAPSPTRGEGELDVGELAQDSPSPFMGEGAGGWGPPLRAGGRGARAYGEAVSVYLAFAVDRSADFLTNLARWLSSNEQIKNLFSRQAIPMLWDYAETNPLSGLSGSWMSQITWVCRGFECLSGGATGSATQRDAQKLDCSKTMLSTDPPYYDNIGYADLSDFFYVWLRPNLRKVYPEVFGTLLVPKTTELVASTFRHQNKEAAKGFFEAGMLATFSNVRSFARVDFPSTVYYAFKQQDAGFMHSSPHLDGGTEGGKTVASTGWETMLSSMIEAGFSVVGTWPVRTESSIRLNALHANALASSIVLVCRPRPEDAPAISRRRFLDALRAELPAAIAEMKTGSIAPVDMAQATIGPGMAIFSRYSQVLEADGRPLTVRMALGLINAALDEVLEEQDAHLDPESRFAVGWFEECAFSDGDFGRADVLARGKNTAVDSVREAGVVVAEGGQVRLINWREYDPSGYQPEQDKRPTVWEGAHHLIERLNHHGEMGAAALYNRLPGDIAESARDLAYRLYHICDRKGWAEDALDYNVLVSSWSEITRLAASARARGDQADMFDDS